jgi:phosphoribosyl-AMP cyclohydrolase
VRWSSHEDVRLEVLRTSHTRAETVVASRKRKWRVGALSGEMVRSLQIDVDREKGARSPIRPFDG